MATCVVCSADDPHSPQVRSPLSLRSISVVDQHRSAANNPDDEHAASNGVQTQRQISVSFLSAAVLGSAWKNWLQCVNEIKINEEHFRMLLDNTRHTDFADLFSVNGMG